MHCDLLGCFSRFEGESVYLLPGGCKLVEEEVDGGSKGKLVQFEAVVNASTECSCSITNLSMHTISKQE